MERNIVIKRISNKLDKKPTIDSLAKFLNLAAKTNGWGELAILMLPRNCNPSRDKCYMGFASFTKPDKHEEAARILHNLYFMDQALIVELNQQPARYQLSNLTMFTEFNSTDDYYYLRAEQESWDEESEAARKVAGLEKRVEELDEINKRQARQITEEQAAARRLERRVEELSDANARQQARTVELEQLEGQMLDLNETILGLKKALKEAHEGERASHRVIGQKDEELARLKEKVGAYAALERVLQRDLVSPTNSIEVVNEMEDPDGGFTVLKK